MTSLVLTEVQCVTQVVGVEIEHQQLQHPGREEEMTTVVSPEETPSSEAQIIKNPIVVESFHFRLTLRTSLLKQ